MFRHSFTRRLNLKHAVVWLLNLKAVSAKTCLHVKISSSVVRVCWRKISLYFLQTINNQTDPAWSLKSWAKVIQASENWGKSIHRSACARLLPLVLSSSCYNSEMSQWRVSKYKSWITCHQLYCKWATWVKKREIKTNWMTIWMDQLCCCLKVTSSIKQIPPSVCGICSDFKAKTAP